MPDRPVSYASSPAGSQVAPADGDTLGTLITPVAPVSPHTATLRVYESFKVDPALYAIAAGCSALTK